MADLPRLTAAQAAQRLGVKPESLYAYVSRGLLGRVRTAEGSTFDPLEVEEFALRRSRRSHLRGPADAGLPLMVIDTDVAVVLDDELFYRGRSAAALASGSTLEEVATSLWGLDADLLPTGDRTDAGRVRGAVRALPASASPIDRLRVAVTVLAAADPLRDDVSPASFRAAGVRMLQHLPAALGDAPWSPGDGIATTLWNALAGRTPGPRDLAALDAALVLVVDHDLAVSTFAARVAASARASAYGVVSAALGAFDSPLHGTAGRPAADMLRRVMAGDDPGAAIAAAVRAGGRGVPGFGQPLYTGEDARALALLPLVARMSGGEDAIAAVDAVAAEVARRVGAQPNVDLALAALAVAGDMPGDSTAAVFAIGRAVGWIAHGLAEYDERPLRLRPRGRYVGPMP